MVVVWANLQNCSIFSLVYSMLHIFSIFTRRVCLYFYEQFTYHYYFSILSLTEWSADVNIYTKLSALSVPPSAGDVTRVTMGWPLTRDTGPSPGLCVMWCNELCTGNTSSPLLNCPLVILLSLLNVFWVFHVTLRFQILKVTKLGAWLNPVSNLVSVYFSSERKLRIMIEIEVCTERVTISNFISLIDNKCSW